MTAPAVSAPVVGEQSPRLQLAPEATSSAAEDAIWLYRMCGRILDPWQELCLRVGCGETLLAAQPWAAFEVGIIVSRQNGKGAVIEALMLASAFIWGNKVTVYSAHHGDTVRKTFRGLKELIEHTPDLARRCRPINDSDDVIELVGGQRLEFRVRTRAGGRGLTGDLVILDEALEVNPDQIASLTPILLAVPHAQLWYFSTVPASGDQHLCSVRQRVLDGDARLAWAEWGVDRKDVAERGYDSPEVLAAANPALGYRLTVERLHDLRRILGDKLFETECLGIWPTMTAGAVLDPKVWSAPAPKGMLDPLSRRAPGADIILSMEMNPLRDCGSIGMFALREDGLEHMQLTDYEAGVDWMVGRAAELRDRLDPALWVIDEKNGAFALVGALAQVGIKVAAEPLRGMTAEEIERATRAGKGLRRGEILPLDASEAATAVGQFIDGFRRSPPIYRQIGQVPADLAVENVKPRPIGDAGQIGWARRKSEVNIGPVVVLTQARYGHGAWLQRRARRMPRSKVW